MASTTIRQAREADRETLRTLWEEFASEQPAPWYVENPREEAAADIDRSLSEGAAFLAEADGEAVGFALAFRGRWRAMYLSDFFVRASARRRGVASALVRDVAAAARSGGMRAVTLNVGAQNASARAFCERVGFREESVDLAGDLGDLESRLGQEKALTASFGSIHIQSDDLNAVERAVRQFVPRLPGGSLGSVVMPPRNGWIAVYDELCDREPSMRRRLARELSDRMGGVVLALGVEGRVVRYLLLERGRIVDEYVSVPELERSLPPGDVIALSANPTVVARLTGASPERVREVARTAASPDELPPAAELVAMLGDVLRVPGTAHGYGEARSSSGAIVIER